MSDDDIERRLRDDAARPLEIQAPPLDPMLTAVRGGARSNVAWIAVAASIVLVGAGAAVLTAQSSGHRDGGAGGDSTVRVHLGGLVPDLKVRGVLIGEPAHPRRLTVVLDGYTCANVEPVVQIDAQDATSVHLTISALRVVREVVTTRPGGGSTGSPTGGPSDGSTPTGDYTDGLTDTPSAGSTPSGGNYTDGLTDTPSAGSTPTAGSTATDRRYIDYLTGAPTVVVAPPCDSTGVATGSIVLDAAPGARKIYVNGHEYVAIDGAFPSSYEYLPEGYDVATGNGLDASTPHLTSGETLRTKSGDRLELRYGQPAYVPDVGSPVSHADVNGHRATISAAKGMRSIAWSLTTGERVQVTSYADTPLPEAAMLTIARGLT